MVLEPSRSRRIVGLAVAAAVIGAGLIGFFTIIRDRELGGDNSGTVTAQPNSPSQDAASSAYARSAPSASAGSPAPEELTAEEAERIGALQEDGVATIGTPSVIGTAAQAAVCVEAHSRSTKDEEFRVAVSVNGREIGSLAQTVPAKGSLVYKVRLDEYPAGERAEVGVHGPLLGGESIHSQTIDRLPELATGSSDGNPLGELACEVGLRLR